MRECPGAGTQKFEGLSEAGATVHSGVSEL